MFIQTEYGWVYIFLCILLSAGAGLFLYYKNPLNPEYTYSRQLNLLLTILRSLSVFMILFLVAGPLMKWVEHRKEKPLILIALDNSQSILNSKDSTFYTAGFPDLLKTFTNHLSDDYEVRTYLFGSENQASSELTFRDKSTNISSVLEEFQSAYEFRNLGAIVMATDGIYNQGESPVSVADGLKCPVFPIAMGDTIQYKDLLIKNTRYNPMVSAGNPFNIQVDIAAYACRNSSTTLRVLCDGKGVYTSPVSISEVTYFKSISIALPASTPGTHHYEVILSPLSGEISKANNKADIFIQSINQKQKICLLANAPHPDIAALANTIRTNENIELTVHLADSKEDLAGDYHLIVAYQVPGINGEGLQWLKQYTDKKIPVLYVLGAQSGLAYLSNVTGNSLTILNNRNNTGEVTAIPNKDFSLFNLEEEEMMAIRKFPPLFAPYGEYRTSGESAVLLRQKIGNVSTEYPLLFFANTPQGKAGFLCGEGFWKWYVGDYEISKHRITTALISKTIQYLIERKDDSPFRIYSKKQFDESEHVTFTAELFNPSKELVNKPDPAFSITNASGKTFRYAFSKSENAYSLDAGVFPPGSYAYESSVQLGPKTYTAKGKFLIAPQRLEFIRTVADHQLLNELAGKTGGKLFYPTQLTLLENQIRENKKISPVIYRTEELKPLIHLKWVFAIILALLTLEWFIRKWNGTL